MVDAASSPAVASRRLLPPPVPALPGALGRRAAGWLVGGLYSLAAVVIWIPLWSKGIGAVVHTGGDTYLNLNLLGWVPRAISELRNPLFDPLLNHPGGLNLLVNTSQPLLGVLLWPVTAISSPAVSLNLAVMASMPLTAATTYVLVRGFVAWRPAAFVAGAVAGFGPYEFLSAAHFHLQLSVTFLIPLIYAVMAGIGRGQLGWRRGGATLAALVVAQFFVSTELLLTALVVSGIAVLLSLLASASARRGIRSSTRAAVLAGGASALVLAYPIWFILRGPGSIRGPVQLVAQAYRTDLLALIIPPDGLALAPSSLTRLTKGFSTLPGENVAYLGVPLVVALVAITIWRRRERSVLVAAGMVAATFVLGLGGSLTVTGPPQLGPSGRASGLLWLPEALLGELPMVKNLIPSRFALYTAIFAGLLLAIGADRLRSRIAGSSPRRAAGIVGALLALCAIPLAPADPVHKPFHRLDSIPAYFSSPAFLAHRPGSAMVVFPYPADPRPAAILWQAQAGYRFAMPSGHAKMPEGPDRHVAYSPDLGYATSSATAHFGASLNRGRKVARTPELRREILGELSRWGTTAVSASLDYIPDRRRAERELVWLLGPSSGRVGLTLYWNAPLWTYSGTPFWTRR